MNAGERMYLEEGNAQLSLEHLHRYSLAAEYCKGKRVLDAACGSGYGSKVLSRAARKTIGIDINKEVIDTNQEKLGNDKLCFKCASIENLPFDDNSFDVVVSFETIEHVQAEIQDKFLMEVKRVLTPTGMLIISTPDKKFYTDYTGVRNPYHIKEFYRVEFEEKLSSFFKNHVLKRQQVYPVSLVCGNEYRFSAYKYDYRSKNCFAAEDDLDATRFDYLICLCSDSVLPDINSSLCIDEQMSVFGAFRGDGAQNAAKVYLPQLKSLELAIAELGGKNQAIAAERDRVVAERDAVVAERDRVVAERDAVVAERDRVVAERDAVAAEGGCRTRCRRGGKGPGGCRTRCRRGGKRRRVKRNLLEGDGTHTFLLGQSKSGNAFRASVPLCDEAIYTIWNNGAMARIQVWRDY